MSETGAAAITPSPREAGGGPGWGAHDAPTPPLPTSPPLRGGEEVLAHVLDAFHARVQASTAVKKLLARWDRLVELRVTGGRSFFLRSKGGAMLPPTTTAEGTPEIVIGAEESVLRGIFSGDLNPARAHLDGQLQAFGSQKDHLVLDAIVLLIWGY